MDDILEILIQDARKSPAEIAEMTGKSEEEVIDIIAGHEKRGTILKYRAVLNPEHIADADGAVRAWIEVSITPQRGAGFDSIAERVYKFSEVKSCYLLSGGFDLLLLVEGHSLQEVAGFVSEKLSTLENVTATSTHFLLKVYKENGDIFQNSGKSERLAISL